MTDDQAPTASDYRRAAVLVLHRRRGNKAGVSAIIEETNAANCRPQLLRAVLVLHQTLIAALLRTQSGINLMADWIHGMATLDAMEPTCTDITRAAQILDYDGQGDREGVATVMNVATGEGRATEVLLQLLDLYEVAMPELSGSEGIDWFERQIELFVSDEHRPGNDENGAGDRSAQDRM